MQETFDDVRLKSLIETIYALFFKGFENHLPLARIFLCFLILYELILLDTRSYCRDWVGKPDDKEFAYSSTEEVLLQKAGLADIEVTIQSFHALVRVHLDYSIHGKEQT